MSAIESAPATIDPTSAGIFNPGLGSSKTAQTPCKHRIYRMPISDRHAEPSASPTVAGQKGIRMLRHTVRPKPIRWIEAHTALFTVSPAAKP